MLRSNGCKFAYMTIETMGDRIRKLRGDMSQSELALRIKAITKDTLSREAVAQWEGGKTKSLKPENLLAVCDIFRIDPWELVYGQKRTASAAVDTPNSASPAEAWPFDVSYADFMRLPRDKRRQLVGLVSGFVYGALPSTGVKSSAAEDAA